jgi:phosphatidylethanolamine-binding protein (PEBP) family uncharacterized protein
MGPGRRAGTVLALAGHAHRPARRRGGRGSTSSTRPRGTNGFGAAGWGGPQPPIGDEPHWYFFHLYAVAQPLDLPDQPSVADVRRATEKQELESGTLVGMFAR